MRKKLLIVEGKEDQSLILALLQKIMNAKKSKETSEEHQIIIEIADNKIYVHDSESDNNAFKKFTTTIKNREEYSHIGIIVDVDGSEKDKKSIHSRWQSFCEIAKKDFGYKLPKNFDKTKLNFQSDNDFAKIGLWLMPDNQSQGMLEDFVRKMIKSDDKLHLHAEDIVNNLPERRFGKTYTSKAIIHTWLAWQKQPNVDIYKGIDNKYFDVETELCNNFIEWIKDLFEIQ